MCPPRGPPPLHQARDPPRLRARPPPRLRLRTHRPRPPCSNTPPAPSLRALLSCLALLALPACDASQPDPAHDADTPPADLAATEIDADPSDVVPDPSDTTEVITPPDLTDTADPSDTSPPDPADTSPSDTPDTLTPDPPHPEHLAAHLVDTEPDDLDDLAPLPGLPFTSSAIVGTQPCSRRSYTTIDNCYNEVHPPPPLIRRSLVRADYTPAADSLAHGTRLTPSTEHTGKLTSLPAHRTSADGRVSVAGGCDGCESLQFRLLRPEAVGHDLTLADGRHLLQHIRDDLYNWIGSIQSRFIIWDPAHSALLPQSTDPLGRLALPDVLQSTLCEETSDRVTSHLSPGASPTPVPEPLPSNPRPCFARFAASDPLEPGDCYDLSLLTGAHATANRSRWELRSVALTLFVRQPKRLSTGSTGFPEGATNPIWAYPRDPSGASWELGTQTLPPFARFEIARAFYRNPDGSKLLACPDASGADLTGANWWECFNPDKRPDAARFIAQIRGPNGHCFDAAGAPRPSAPGFCEYFFRQHRASTLFVDDDEDATLGNGRPWNGRTGGCGSDAQCREGGFALFESITTADGRLLFVNVRGVFYAYNALSPCRADGFANLKPISWMPADPEVNTRYDIARVTRGQPFRDPLDQPIPFGVNNTGAYPWVDRRGRNLFYAAQNLARDGWYARAATFLDHANQTTDTVTQTTAPTDNTRRQLMNPDHGPGTQYAILGSWTHGKAVLVDELNGADFGGGDAIPSLPARSDAPRTRYTVPLYSPRANDPAAAADLVFQSKGVQSVSSFEHVFGIYDALRPLLPFDVVWTMQTDIHRNVELAFDPWLDPRALVVAHMNAPLDMKSPPVDANIRARASAFVQDGFVPTANAGALVRYGETADFRFRVTPRLQNAATTDGSSGLRIAPFLLLRGGARVEPVGMGGVLGKGVYLDGYNDFIDVLVPDQRGVRDYAASVWLDLRDDALGVRPRTIFHWPDGSFVALRASGLQGSGTYEILFWSAGDETLRALPATGLIAPSRWFHLHLAVRGPKDARRMEVRLDGTRLGTLHFAPSRTDELGFSLVLAEAGASSRTRIGEPPPEHASPAPIKRRTWKGWVDELRIRVVPAHEQLDPSFGELACNEALGTLVDLEHHPDETPHPALTALRARAQRFTVSPEHGTPPTELCEQLQLTPGPDESLQVAMLPRQRERGLCIDRVHANPRPEPDLAARCLRNPRIGQPPLTWDAPRPDTSGTPFCLTCHYDAVATPGLTTSALTRIPDLPRWQDPRRQPLHVPARLTGRRPAALSPPTLPEDAPLDRHFDHAPFLAPLTE